MQSVETTFHQDLNGDGTVGPLTTAIEASGSTSLVQLADTYFLYALGGTTGPQVSFNGSPVTAGQYGSSWTLIGGEQVGGGYEVAWKTADQYVIWNHDSDGAFVSNTLGTMSGGTLALQSLETTSTRISTATARSGRSRRRSRRVGRPAWFRSPTPTSCMPSAARRARK